ncbi:hypothetical protein CO662_13300 [Rhizobium anhuiense]|uniref:Uncharacterized protein n=2 Tax=Rhizobium/Agrobacterium group TaxID=227290 RepID=A0ABX4J9K6_9HYPH|nr:hypothetical protein CO668_07545 [Rhizobium anhuiense]PDS51440.1 hypothetical protein CO662_13300 [Rhizobium anhuiense]
MRSGEWTGKMADFSMALQEACTVGRLHLRFSRAMLTEIRTLAEVVPLAHKGSMTAGRKQMA